MFSILTSLIKQLFRREQNCFENLVYVTVKHNLDLSVKSELEELRGRTVDIFILHEFRGGGGRNQLQIRIYPPCDLRNLKIYQIKH